jgi:hypothetical protein
MRIFLDIETAPGQADWVREEVAAGVKPPATLKKAESISAWFENEYPHAVEEAWHRTGLDGTFGQVVCIGYALNDEAPHVGVVRDLSRAAEVDMLFEFFDAMHDVHDGSHGRVPQMIGHNVINFDLRFLWMRAVVCGIKPPMWWPRDPKPWGEAVYDTMTQWCGARDRISLDRLCRALGLEGKGDGPTGADVWPMVQRGEWGAIADYCKADVERTRNVYRRMTFTEVRP